MTGQSLLLNLALGEIFMKIYSFPQDYEKKSEDFIVSYNGKKIDVYSCDVSAYPLNRVWQGKQRDFYQTEKSSFVMFGSDDAVTVDIKTVFAFDTVCVRPLSKNIKPVIKDGTVSIKFPKSGQYSVEFDDMHSTLAVFINPETEFCNEKKDVLYFGAGVHIIDERIELQDNQTVFIDEGAVLYGSINATDKKNVSIVGYGILDNSRMMRADEINGCAVLAANAGKMTGNPVFFNRCENVLIDGITIVDSSGWNIYLDGCTNAKINNIKLIGQWRYNADGCDFCNCTNGIIQNSFLRTFDDCITVKGFKLNNMLPVQNILVQSCVLWCDWGRALEVGAETCAPYIQGITFQDCDIIHGSAVMMDIQHGDRASINNILFDDIRIEYSGNEQKLIIQTEENEVYPDTDTDAVPIPFVLTAGVTMWSIDDYSGNMSDIYFKNIKITTHKPMIPQGSEIMSRNADSKINNVYFENITVNDERCNFEMLGVKIGSGAYEIYCDKNIAR